MVVRKGKSMRKLPVLSLVFFAAAALLVSSCAQQDTARLRLDTKSMLAMSDDGMRLGHVIINVTGPGMSDIIIEWDGGGSDGQVAAPEYFEVVAPAGPDRFIQYIGVYKNEKDEMKFYYADQLMNLNSGDVSVDLVASSFGGLSTEKSLVGRYLRANGTAPTGELEWLIHPPGNKRPLKVGQEFIYSGWLSFMVFDGVPVTYRVQSTGEILFDKFTTEHVSSQFGGTPSEDPAHLLKLSFPVELFRGHYEEEDFICRSGGMQGKEVYFGYFGPGAQGQTVLKQETGQVPDLYTACDFEPSAASWNDSAGVEVRGGLEIQEGCSPHDHETVCLGPESVSNGTGQLYASGPLKLYASGFDAGDHVAHPHGALLVHYWDGEGEMFQIEWSYLPGVIEDALKSTHIYTRLARGQSDSMRDREEELLRMGCTDYLLKEGFVKVDEVPAGSISGGTTFYFEFEDSKKYAGKDIAICPQLQMDGRVAPAHTAGIYYGHPEAFTEAPGAYYFEDQYHKEYHTSLASLQVTVQNVKSFEYAMTDDECDGVNWLTPSQGQKISLSFADEGYHYLCVRAKNSADSEWGHPQRTTWVFDQTQPQMNMDEVFCTSDGDNFKLSFLYEERMRSVDASELFSKISVKDEDNPVAVLDANLDSSTDMGELNIWIPAGNYTYLVATVLPFLDLAGNPTDANNEFHNLQAKCPAAP